MKKILLSWAVVAVCVCASHAQATVLTFNDLGLSNYGDIPLSYGDNVNALSDGVGSYGQGNAFTPNLVVDYRSLNLDGSTRDPNLDFWASGYGDLENVAFSPTSGYLAEIYISSQSSAFNVRLNSFDLSGYYLADKPDQTVKVLDGLGNTLVDYSPFDVVGAGSNHSFFAPNLVSSTGFRIVFGPDWNTGIDNINFDQVSITAGNGNGNGHEVPEPASISLMGLALTGGAYLRRKRQCQKM